VSNLQDKQALGNDLHPGTNGGDGQAKPKQPKVAMPERAKSAQRA
jgi:hypothetical protein